MNTTTVNSYEYSAELSEPVKALFKILLGNTEIDPDDADLSLEEAGEFVMEAAKILKLSPMGLFTLATKCPGIDIYDDGTQLTFKSCVAYANALFVDLFRDSVFTNILKIEDEVVPNGLRTYENQITLTFHYGEDTALDSLYTELLIQVIYRIQDHDGL